MSVREWLADSETKTFILVAEFGEGKSFFTYSFSRILIEEFLKEPGIGWIPLRIPLKNYAKAGDAVSLLKQRLDDFGASLSDWNEVTAQNNVLVILDGFDEMSLEMTRPAFTESLKRILDCKELFSSCKIIITSRPNDLGGKRDLERIMDWMDRPRIMHITPPSRSTIEAHLEKFVEHGGNPQMLSKLRRMHDPIGLSAKPLFLQMLKDTLEQLPIDLDVISLYDCYSRNVLERKVMLLLKNERVLNTKEELVQNLLDILEIVAVAITRASASSFSLKDIDSGDHSFAEMLWKSSDPEYDDLDIMRGNDSTAEDARARVRTRSLLTRIESGHGDDTWTVDFCHRSMREFFAARALARAILTENGSRLESFYMAQLNWEILEFCAIILMRSSSKSTVSIVRLLEGVRYQNRSGRIGGYLLTLLFKIGGGDEIADLSGLNLDSVNLAGADLSDKNFSGSSLRYGVLDNTILDRTNFDGCDMTGVRVEETTAALGIACLQERIFAIYSDLTVRVWSGIFSDNVKSKVVYQFSGIAIQGFGVVSDSLLWIHSDEFISIYIVDESDMLHECCRFTIRTDVASLFLGRNSLIASSCKRRVISHRSLGLNQDLLVFEGVSGKHLSGDTTGLLAIVMEGGIVKLFNRGNTSIEINDLPSNENPTSIAMERISKSETLVACGYDSGRVMVWKILEGDSDAISIIYNKQIHIGMVSSVGLVDTILVSGSIDKEVVVSQTNTLERTGELNNGVRLGLRVRCKDTKVAGIKGDREVSLFHELICREGSEFYSPGSVASE